MARTHTPLVTAQWVPVRFVLDLVNHRQQIYYNNDFMGQSSYLPTTIELGVQPHAGCSATYLDDVSATPTTWPAN
jgi:hypothetical protein